MFLKCFSFYFIGLLIYLFWAFFVFCFVFLLHWDVMIMIIDYNYLKNKQKTPTDYCPKKLTNAIVRLLRVIQLYIHILMHLLYHAHTIQLHIFEGKGRLGKVLFSSGWKVTADPQHYIHFPAATKPLTRQMALHWQTILTHSYVKTSNLKVSYPYMRFGKSQVSE